MVYRALTPPKACALWENPELVNAPTKDRFDLLEVFLEDSHHWRYLLECRECGQYYFFEFFEWVDMVEGNHSQYVTYLPVETDEEIETLKDTSVLEILEFYPQTQRDLLRDGTRKVYWVTE